MCVLLLGKMAKKSYHLLLQPTRQLFSVFVTSFLFSKVRMSHEKVLHSKPTCPWLLPHLLTFTPSRTSIVTWFSLGIRLASQLYYQQQQASQAKVLVDKKLRLLTVSSQSESVGRDIASTHNTHWWYRPNSSHATCRKFNHPRNCES